MLLLTASIVLSTFSWLATAVNAPPAPAVQAGARDDGSGSTAPKRAPSKGVEKAPDAKQQLKRADEARRLVRGKGEERRAAVEQALASYNAVLEYYPEAKHEVSMGLFRIAELKRSLGLLDDAREAFRKVVELGADRKLSARALFESAHIYRKSREFGKALEMYRKTAVEFNDVASTRDDSLYWIGTLHMQNKDYEKARESWRAVAERGADALDRVRAFDRIAGSFLKQGKTDTATQTIQEAKQALHEAASEPSSHGARVKKALDRMTTIRAIERLKNTKDGKATGGGAPPEAPEDDEDDDDNDRDSNN
jgi:tetratricopeptide (TPR) repeat protein